MANRRRVLALGGAACLEAGLAPAASRASGLGGLFKPAPKPQVGKAALDFHATTFDGQKVGLDTYQGRVLVLNFWATWCGPCRKELPLLDAYYRAQRAFGLEVLAVTLEERIPISALAPLAARVSFKMARRFSGPYGDTGAVPTNYVVDRAGTLRYARDGAFHLALLNEVLVPLLRETPPDAAKSPAAPIAS
jgi:thiol-disulfide isomerase/thioredoxin